jgi:hypothetical protein
MNRRQRAVIAIFYGAFFLGPGILGCQRSSSTAQSRQIDKRPAAEKSFDEIAQIVKNALETGGGGAQGFVAESGTGRTQFTVRNEVKSELIPPASSTDNYRGKILVTSSTTYSMRRISDSDKKLTDQDKRKSGGQDPGTNPADDKPTTPNGLEVLNDSASASTAKTKLLPGSKADDTVARRAEDETHTYELAYENNRWVLKTELDKQTELAVINAFNYALSLQP